VNSMDGALRKPFPSADSVTLLALAVFGALVLWSNHSFPQPVAPGEALSDFSAQRAFSHLSVIAQEP